MSSKAMLSKVMNLSIRSPYAKLFQGEVSSVGLPGSIAPFQVLPGHAPMVGSLIAGNVTYKIEHTMVSLEIKQGFVAITNNEITVVCEL